MKILVIEDEAAIRELIIEMLEIFGWESVGFRSAEDALQELKKAIFQLAICDLNLPGMRGTDFVRYCADRYPGIKHILTSGSNCDEVKIQCLEAGADGFLPKPYDVNQLNEMILSITNGESQ
ncbi:MAG: response regulator [Patescibacteria group bacterium]|jgi:CheY-like chemotaxis protein